MKRVAAASTVVEFNLSSTWSRMACLVVLKEAARAASLTYEDGSGRVLASRLCARNATSTVVRPLIAERSVLAYTA